MVLRKNEITILRNAERSMMRVMCGVKLVEKGNMEKLMDRLGLKKAADKLARTNGVRRHVMFFQPEENVSMKAM